MPDYNQGGFHEDGSGIYADPTVQGSPSDYDSWDWKQIMAAITGGSALVPGAGGEAHAASVSSPQTLMKAANDFQYIQEVMAMVAKSLADQSKALAGGKGAPWQGGAADAFTDQMTTFSKQVASNAEALGGGSTGSSVAQNLVWSANALNVAQANIHAIDVWYANQAALLGVKTMSNGLMPISQKPELVQMMTDDMRAELKKLATNYAQVSQNLGRVQPKQVISPAKDPGSAGGGSGGNRDIDLSKLGGGGGSGGSGGPDLSKLGGSGGAGGPDLSTAGGGGGGGASLPDLGTGGGEGGGTGSASPFPGGAGMPDLTAGGGGGLGDPGAIGDPAGAGAVSPFPGGGSTGNLGSAGGGPDLPDLNGAGTGTGDAGGLGGTGGAVDPFTGGATLPDLPVGTGGAGAGAGAGGGGGTGTIEPFPGAPGSGLNDILNPSAGSGTGVGSGAGSGVPLLPGFGSVGTPSTGNTGSSTAGQGLAAPATAWTGGAQTPELGTGGAGTALPEFGGAGVPEVGGAGVPDALPSGLVGGAPGLGTSMPSSGLVSSPGLPDTSAVGGSGGAGAGGGMPMMPMAPGMGAGAGGQGAGAERPDASGLLGGEVKPWTGGANLGALPETAPVAGAAAGGPGLSGLDVGQSVDPIAGLAAAPELGSTPSSGASGAGESGGMGAGMPMMPMAPGMGAGAGAQGTGAERPDASGLLGGEAAPWTGGASLGALPETAPVAGAAAGGPGLSGLDVGQSVDSAGGLAAAPELGSTPSSGASGAGESGGAGAGMPMMPMAPGMGAAGAGAGGAAGERPDSAGLLEAATEPWTADGEAGAEAGAEPVAGAPSGGSELSGMAAPAAAAGAAAAFVPVLPVPALPAAHSGAGGAAARERTESSALLGSSAAAWSPDEAETSTATASAAVAASSEETPAGSREPEEEGATAAASGAPRGTSPDAQAQMLPVVVPAGLPAPEAARTSATPREGAVAESTTTQGAAAESAPAGEPAGAAPLPDLPDDRVPVLAQSEGEGTDDTSTWDVAAAGFGMLMLAFAGQGAADGAHQESTSRYAVAGPEVWDAAAGSAVRTAERTVDPATAVAEPELTTWRPTARAAATGPGGTAPAMAPDEEFRCGNGAIDVPDEPEPTGTGPTADGEEEDDDAEENGAVDLLTQDASTWGARPAAPDSIG